MSHSDDAARARRDMDASWTRATEDMRAAERDREIAQLEEQLEDQNPDSLWYRGDQPVADIFRQAAAHAPTAYTAPAPIDLPDAPTVTARCKRCGAKWRAGLQQCQVCQSAEWWIEE